MESGFSFPHRARRPCAQGWLTGQGQRGLLSLLLSLTVPTLGAQLHLLPAQTCWTGGQSDLGHVRLSANAFLIRTRRGHRDRNRES